MQEYVQKLCRDESLYTQLNFGWSATFDKTMTYRYHLSRTWDNRLKNITFIGLNPSTADAFKNDPTVTRCINFAKRWNYGSMVMLNIFAYRATEVKKLYEFIEVSGCEENPIGPENDRFIKEANGDTVVCWGNDGIILARSYDVLNNILAGRQLYCFGLNKGGEPKHPLYLRHDTPLIKCNFGILGERNDYKTT